MGRAFLVVGAESTGTRAVTRLLMDAGCAGDSGHVQRFDGGIPMGLDRIVWRRSVPHAGQWPMVSTLLVLARNAGYEPRVIVTMRDWTAAAASQVAMGHVQTTDQALRHLQRAYWSIFRDLGSVDYTIVNYESFAAQPKAIGAFFASVGLDAAAPHKLFYDGNAKWFP